MQIWLLLVCCEGFINFMLGIAIAVFPLYFIRLLLPVDHRNTINIASGNSEFMEFTGDILRLFGIMTSIQALTLLCVRKSRSFLPTIFIYNFIGGLIYAGILALIIQRYGQWDIVSISILSTEFIITLSRLFVIRGSRLKNKTD